MPFSYFFRFAAFALVAAFATACSGSGDSLSAPSLPANVTTTTADAVGDATTPAVGATPWDITQVTTSRPATGATALTVSVTFNQAISAANLPAPGTTLTSPTQLGIAILMNTGAAGSTSTPTGCAGAPSFPNVAFAVDDGTAAGRLADGNYTIVRISPFSSAGEATFAFTGPNTITYTIPLAAIGGGTGGIQIAVLARDGSGFTDCAPNASYIST
ncbi:MAG: hypothetical protein NVSMB31_12900 [Vulcanimicrobiaceae bacterium]